jgi:hypothetical protein
MNRKILISICAIVLLTGCTKKDTSLSIFTKKINCEDCLVTREKTAIGIAESILFENYGEDKIKSEKPYIVSIEQDSLWNIRGSFNKIGFGGVFNIKISAKDGRVIDMYHEK